MDSFRNLPTRDVWAGSHARASIAKTGPSNTMGRALLWGVPIGVSFWMIIAALIWMT